MTTDDKHVVEARNASLIAGWFRDRGGIKVWGTLDVLDPYKSWTTPANDERGQPVLKPHWAADPNERLITDVGEVVISYDREVTRFPVEVRLGKEGMKIQLTDDSTHLVREAVRKAGEGSYHQFDMDSQQAMIFSPSKQVPLSHYIKEQINDDDSRQGKGREQSGHDTGEKSECVR